MDLSAVPTSQDICKRALVLRVLFDTVPKSYDYSAVRLLHLAIDLRMVHCSD